MTQEERNEILKRYEVSLTATAQALHRRFNISCKHAFEMLAIPMSKTSVKRYWDESYDAKPWKDRSDEERLLALDAAEHIFAVNISQLVKGA